MRALFIITLSMLCSDLFAQVIIRCPQGDFNNSRVENKYDKKFRCVPNEESILSNWTITPCDCDNVENIYDSGLNASCKRTITLYTDSLIYPTEHMAFDYPYFSLDPSSFINMLGPTGFSILFYLDPNNETESDSDPNEAAIVLRIDTVTLSTTFDAWVPFDKEASFRLFTGYDENLDRRHRDISILDNYCGDSLEFCQEVIRNPNISVPAGQSIPDIINLDASLTHDNYPLNIKVSNINISGDVPLNDLELTFSSESEDAILLNATQSPFGTDLNLGFSDFGAIDTIPSDATVGIEVFPKNKFRDAFFGYYFDQSYLTRGDWSLSVKNNSTSAFTTLNSWTLEVCDYKVPCDIYYRNTTSLVIPNSESNNCNNSWTGSSVITIPNEGMIRSFRVENVDITHTWISDLALSIVSPDLDTVLLVDVNCIDEDDLNIGFTDPDQTADLLDFCPPVAPLLVVKSEEPLSQFYGKQSQGDWQLLITDECLGYDGGRLNSWTLNICLEDCESDAVVRGLATIPRGNRTVKNTIESTHIHKNSNQELFYKAGQSITLKKGFEVRDSSIFLAQIGDCNNN